MTKFYTKYRKISQAGAVITICIALLMASLRGFGLHIDAENNNISIFFFFILTGITFLLLGKPRTDRTPARIISCMPAVSVIMYFIYFHLIPLFKHQLISVHHHHYIDYTTYAGTILISLALILIKDPKFLKVYQSMLIVAISLAFLSFIGALYGSDMFVEKEGAFIMESVTSLLFLIISASILLTHPDKGIMEVYLNPTSKGSLLRRLSLVLTAIPIAAGWLGLQYEDAGAYTRETGDTFFIFLFIVIPIALIWRNLHQLYKAEKKIEKGKDEIFSNEIKFRAIIENSHDAMFIKDLEGRYIMANPATAAAFELSVSDIIGKTDLELSGRPLGDKVNEINGKIIQEKITLTYETPLEVEGKRFYYHMTKFPYYSGSGDAIGIIGIARNITEKKNNEIELSMLSLIARYSTNSVLIMDKHTNIEWVNKGFTEKTLYTFDEVKGKKPLFLNGPLTPEKAIISMRDAVIKDIPFTQETLTYRKDGSYYNSSVEITPIKNNEGETERYAVVETDITEKVIAKDAIIRAKNAAEKTGKAKEDFLANMSHEIRTPMNAIIGFTDLLIRSDISGEERTYLDLIKTSGETLLTIINDILDFSKMEAQKLTIVNRVISIHDILKLVSQLLSLEVEQKKLDLVVFIDSDIPDDLFGDATRLNQILLNLLSNAIKFTPSGIINISARMIESKGRNVTIEFKIKDTGIGIPKEKLNTIFESFSQATSNTTRLYGGTGLGLAIVKKLLELMGGEIFVKSVPGSGSEFIFHLPFGVPEAKPISARIPEQVITAMPHRKLNILIVEDNKVNIILIKKIISTFGFVSDVAENGMAAIKKVQTNVYDLILMDIQMPVMDGLTATRIIRKSHSLTIPIIAITASILESDKDKCFAAGMNDFVTKPFNAEELYQKIVFCTTPHKIAG